MEIERKFLIRELPADLESYPHERIEQGYLCTDPVVRVRRQGDRYLLTYKGRGLMAREETNLPLTEEAYAHLIQKADGRIIAKTRYRIPYLSYTIELDLFDEVRIESEVPLIMAEVEFPTLEEAGAFVAPTWFGDDVTEDVRYHNSRMSAEKSFANSSNCAIMQK